MRFQNDNAEMMVYVRTRHDKMPVLAGVIVDEVLELEGGELSWFSRQREEDQPGGQGQRGHG